jgi:hypothetical protein
MEDFSALRYVHDQAQSLHIGSGIALIPQLDDPKDLYQLIKPVAATTCSTGCTCCGSTCQEHEALEAIA